MSDDRFKQARKNLYDKHNQRQQDSGFGDFEDEATAMVNIGQAQQHIPAPAPGGNSMVIGDGFDEGFSDEATAFVSLPELQQNAPPSVPPPAQNYGGLGEFGGEATDFVNINDLQMDLGGGGDPILTDPVLQQSYQYGPESIQNLTSTLIFAQNVSGQSVILKRVWTEDPSTFPNELKERIAVLDGIRHPNLVVLNGMLATPTGVWIELSRPPGYRLTDVIMQNGPQPSDVVFGWLAGVGDALDEIHRNDHVHAGLTPDAIWVQSEGGVMLEPFDLLAFEDRGDLSPFGPREMTYAPDQRELTASTDTFCLANIAFAALTGLPIDLGKASEVDPKVAKALQRALSANPRERFQTASEFLKPFRKAGGEKRGLPDLNFKYLVIGIGVLLIGVVGVLYLKQQQNVEAARKAAIANAKPVPFDIPEDGPDPRVKIEIDLKTDPVNDASTRLLDKVEKRKAERARIEAREDLDGVSSLIAGQRREKYNASLSAITRAIRISGQTDEDAAFLADMRNRKDVVKIRQDYFIRISQALEKEKAGSARIAYTSFAAIEPDAPALTFFNRNKTAEIKQLISISEIQNEETE